MSTFINIAALRANTSSVDFLAYVEGYYVGADGGEGYFYLDQGATGVTDNGGTVILDAVGQVWKRNLGGNPPNTKQFGAKGDQVTDDTIAIQNALNLGGTIVHSGYSITGTLFMGSFTSFISNNGVLKPNAPNITVLANAAGNTSNVLVQGFIFTNDITSPNGVGISFAGNTTSGTMSNIRIKDCQFYGFNPAIYIFASLTNIIENCTTLNCTRAFVNDTAGDSIWSNCIVEYPNMTDPANNDFAFTIANTGNTDFPHVNEGVQIVSCSCNGQAGGIIGNQQNWTTVSDGIFTGCTKGCALALMGCANWQITGGQYTSTSTQTNIYTDESCFSTNISNVFVWGAGIGMALSGQYATVSGCQFESNNLDLLINGTAKYSNISGSIFGSAAATSVTEVTGANYTLVNGNQVRGVVTLTGTHSQAGLNMTIV